jgi:hypothetical protein
MVVCHLSHAKSKRLLLTILRAIVAFSWPLYVSYLLRLLPHIQDAIGMGLNLNIGRVIFSTVKKYDGGSERFLTPAEIRQIAGRAGRR